MLASKRNDIWNPSKLLSRRKARMLMFSGALAGVMLQRSFAANGSWTGVAGDGSWATGGNWDTIPGANDATFVSPDVALFSAATTPNVVTVDLNRNVAGITFDTSAATNAFAVGSAGANAGETLNLTGGGQTTVTASSATTTSAAINSP